MIFPPLGFPVSAFSSVNLAAPGPIGATTPAAGSFTTLSNTGPQTTTVTGNTAVWNSTGYSLTGSDATGMVNLLGFWNTTGVPTAFNVSITDTASGNASNLFNFQYTNGSTNFVRFQRLTSTTNMFAIGGTGSSLRLFEAAEANPRSCLDSTGLRLGSNVWVRWTSASSNALGTVDVGIFRNAIGVLEINDGINAALYRDLKVRALRVDTAANAGSGTAVVTSGTSSIAVSNSLVSATSRIIAVSQDQLVAVQKATPGSGAFTIYMTGNVAADTTVQYFILP